MKPILKAIYIIMAIFMLASCMPNTEENATQKNETEKPETTEKVTKADEEMQEDEAKQEEQKAEVVTEETSKTEGQVVCRDEFREWTDKDYEPKERVLKKEKTPDPYRSDNKEYFKKGSLLFYNLNIDDTFEVASEKLKTFGVKGLSEIKAMPEELKKLGCKAYVPHPETYKKDIRNDFYIIFKDNKIIRFIKYQAGKNNLLYFIENITLEPEEEDYSCIEKYRRVSGKGYSYYEEAVEKTLYREEFYYLRRIYTVIITRDEYKDYFEKFDRESDSILEYGDLYLYGLDIRDNIETVKAKFDKNGIKYEDRWFDEREYFINYNGGYSLVNDGFAGIESVDNKVVVWCFKDRIVKIRFDPDIEQAYVLLQHFRRRYRNNYDLNDPVTIESVAFLNRCLILLLYGEKSKSISFLLEDPSIVDIFSHSVLDGLFNKK